MNFSVDQESQGTLTTDLVSDGRELTLKDDSNNTYLVQSSSTSPQVFHFTLNAGDTYTLSAFDILNEEIGTHAASSAPTAGDNAGYAMDLEAQAVPEPSTMGIALCGVFALLLRRRRSSPTAG